MAVETGIGPYSSGFTKFCLDTSGNTAPEGCRTILIGPRRHPSPATSAVISQIYSVKQAEDLFGPDSILADAIRTYFCQCETPRALFATELSAGAGASVAEYQIDFSGPATANGTLVFKVNGENVYSIAVVSGETEAQTATKVAIALNSDPRFIYSASVLAGGIVNLIATTHGETGNHLSIEFNPNIGNNFPSGVGVALIQTVIGSAVYDIEPAIAAMGACCYDCIGMLWYDETQIQKMVTHLDDATGTWACARPNCFGHLFHAVTPYNIGNSMFGVKGMTEFLNYGNATNDQERNIIPVPNDYPIAPWRFTAAWAGRQCCVACEDPGTPVRLDRGMLACLKDARGCGGFWTAEEKDALVNAGIAVWDISGSTGSNNTLWIEENVTNYKRDAFGRNDRSWKRAETRYLVARFVRDLNSFYYSNFTALKLVSNGTPVREGTRAVNPNIVTARLRAWARDRLGFLIDDDANLDNVVNVERDTDTVPGCNGDPDRINVRLNIDFVNQLLRIATSVNVRLEACDF